MLKGQKVMLREKRISDAREDYTWRADEELARLDASVPIKLPFSDFMTFYVEELEYPTPRRRRFAIDSLDGKHIGNCMYYDVDFTKKEAEVGIMIGDKAYWNKGYGTDAITTLLEYIFSSTILERVYLHTLDWNIRAQKCFEKCGFTTCGKLQRNGRSFVVMEALRNGQKNPLEKHSKGDAHHMKDIG